MSVPHPETHIGCQTFTWLLHRWCVTRAHELIAAHPDAAESVPAAGITNLAELLPLDPTPGWVPLIRIEVDPDHAMTTDLDSPILAVRVAPEAEQDMGSIVIDGWHRVYRALREGRTTLPAYLLTEATERAARYPLPYTPEGSR